MQTIKRNAGFLFFLSVIIFGTWLTSDETGGFSFEALFSPQISDRADDRDNVDEIYKRAREFDANGDFEKAVVQYSSIIERNPNDAIAYENRCWAYYRLNKLEHAISDCTSALEINPDFSDALAKRCFTYQKMDENEKAIEDCTQVMTMDTSYASVYTARADAYRHLGDLDSALADYNRSLEMDSINGVAYNNRALLHKKMGNNELAMSDYNNAIKYYDPKTDYNVHVRWHNRGILYHEMGEYDKAIYDFRKSIDIFPSNIRAMVSLADIFYELERYTQALELYETVVRLEDNGVVETEWDTSWIPETIDDLREKIEAREKAVGEHIDLLYAGREAQIREDYAGAIESYTELIDLVPEYLDTYYWRAQSLEELKLNLDALNDYQSYYDKASEGDEFYYSASYRIENLNLFVNYDSEAVRLYQEALDIQYEDPEAALKLYAQAMAIEPTFTQIYQQRAYLNYYSIYDWNAALVDYQSYAEISGNPDVYRYEILTLQAMVALPDAAQACLLEVEQYYYDYETELSGDDLIERYTCIIDLAPDYAPAYKDRGEQYEYDYRYIEAVADYEMYLSLIAEDEALIALFDAINDEDYYDNYDYDYYDEDIYYYSPDYVQSSLEILIPYVALPAETLEQWQNAHHAYYDDENLLAINYLSQVIDTEPDFADAVSLRGRIYYEDADYEKSLPDLQAYILVVNDEDVSYYEQTLVTEIEALLALPSEVQDLYRQAKIEVNDYEYQAAIDIYTQVIEAHPDIVDAYFQRGKLYQYVSDYDLALADLDKYISLAGEDNPHAGELEWTMEYLNNILDYNDENDD